MTEFSTYDPDTFNPDAINERVSVKPSSSLLEALRAKQDESKQPDTMDLLVPRKPGGPQLYVRYNARPVEDIVQDPKKYDGLSVSQRMLASAADTLVTLCEQVYVRASVEDELVPLADALEYEYPIKFDKQLADVLELGDVRSARQIVLAFYGERFEGAVLDHAGKLARWLSTGEAASPLDLI